MHDRIRTAMLGGGLNSAVGRTHEIARKMDDRLQRMAGFLRRNADINARTGVVPGRVDEVAAVIQYDHNLMVNAWEGKAAPGYRNGRKIRVVGSQGGYEWGQDDPETVTRTNASGDTLTSDRISTSSAITTDSRYKRFKAGHPSGLTEAFANYHWDIADAMQAARLNEYTLSTAVAVEGIAVCHATRQSSLTGRSGALAEIHAGH